MQPAYYIIFIFLIIYLITTRRNNSAIANKVIKNRKSEDTTKMIELAKRFIGKECIISSFDSTHQFTGVIKEVTDSAILIENKGTLEAINLEFVIRIREYPRNNKGKKKSAVLD